MIHYHGGPVTPVTAARRLWQGRHAMVSFARTDQLELAAEVCQSFALDNGAFSHWQKGGTVDVEAYRGLVECWMDHPGFDWCLIPDIIDGTEADNKRAVATWRMPDHISVPVWHLHESLDYLKTLAMDFPRVAIGSSGQWPEPGRGSGWWTRMAEAFDAVCEDGRPICKLHGLRMLSPTIFSVFPFASADSCNVARNIGLDERWDHQYLRDLPKNTRAEVLAARIESHASASRWGGLPKQRDLFNAELLG